MKNNFKVKKENKKEIGKLALIIILVSIIFSIINIIMPINKIVENIILYVMAIFYIVMTLIILKKINEEEIVKKEDFEEKYNPILNQFLLKNEFIPDEKLIKEELSNLIERGYIERTTKNEQEIYILKNREKFKTIDSLEKITQEKIKEYSTEEIPSYESLFVNKILFAFENEISQEDLNKKIQNNYYYERGQICKLTMERMLLFELEKNNMLKSTKKNNIFAIVLIINIIADIIFFVTMARFNIILLLSIIINIALDGMMLKNEKLMAYNFTDEVNEYIEELLLK